MMSNAQKIIKSSFSIIILTRSINFQANFIYNQKQKVFQLNQFVWDLLFNTINNIYFCQSFRRIFESQWAQERQNTAISQKRGEIWKLIFLINTNAINGELFLIFFIIIKQHIFMDSPNPRDFHWPNANTLLSNCTQLFPLDRMLTFCFQYKGKINLNNIDTATEFFKNNQRFQNQIVQFLIEMIEKVCSVAFNLLASKKCNDNQAKCYAAKNMLENIKYLCLEVSRIINNSQDNQKRNKKQKIEQLTRDIAQFICSQIKVYIEQIFPKYPSTPLSGYSQRLKNAIRSIDRRQDYTYDFLHIHKLQIGDAKNTQELISQIMIFLNKVKSAPYEKIQGKKDQNWQQDAQQETYEECFQKFNKNLVWIISQKNISQKMIKGINPLGGNKDQNLGENNKLEKNQKQIQNISKQQQGKGNKVKADKPQEKNKQNKTRNSCLFQFLVSPSQNKLLKIMKLLKGNQRQNDWKLIQQYQQELKQYQREHKFVANAKISMNALQFQKSQINNAELRFKNSALLRVVVKWVEDLQETLKESKKYIRDNGFKFKIKKQGKQQISQKQISLNEGLVTLDYQKRTILQSAIKKAQSSNNKQNSNKINMFLVDSLMNQEQQTPHYNFQNSLKLSSQVNAFIGKETVQKLIKLISILGSIPQHLEQQIVQYLKIKNQNKGQNYLEKDMRELKPKLLQQLNRVNLVSNRIGDLLRSKIVCTEPQFIKLLTLLYQLDKYCLDTNSSNKNEEKIPFFKLIRIKNKLKDTTNNVHINYMFYGKIQCELQICFLNNKKVQNANQTMHHFLYEIKRGIYGVVPQLANIVNQNDPICQHNQRSNLSFIKYSQKVSKHRQFQERKISQSQKNKYILRCIYKNCNQFSLQSSKKFITNDEKQHKNQCLKCYVQKNKSQQNLFDALKKLQYSYQDKWIKDVLEKRTEIQIQEITKNEQEIPGLYLMIYPTQKRIIVKLCIIFKHYKTGKLIIKCIQQNSLKDQSSEKALEFQTQKVYKEHKSMKKLYFKVNRFKLRGLLQNNNDNSNKKDIVSLYIKNLSKKYILSLKHSSVKQFDKALHDKQFQNKQQHIRLNQMQSITNELEEYCQEKQSLMFVQRVYAQSISLEKLLPISKFPSLKELHLKGNKLSGSLTIFNHLSLTYIDLSHNYIHSIKLENLKVLKEINLSHNRITKIELYDLKDIKDIKLGWNKIKKIELKDLKALTNLNLDWNKDLNQFDFIGLTSLHNLSMWMCGLQGCVIFREQLSSLQTLNVPANLITKLDLRNCPSLKNLNCLANPPIQLIFNKETSLKSMEAYNLKSLPQFSLGQLQKIDVCLSADQITQLYLRYLRGDNYLSNLFIFDHIQSNKTQLQKLKSITIRFDQSKQQSIKLKQWQQNAVVGQLLQQFIANLSNLTLFNLIDQKSTVLLQHLDLSRVQQQIQDLYIESKTLKSLKLNKVKKIWIQLQNLDKLQILTPRSLKQLKLYGINKYIYSQLTETSFFQKCANMQSIIIVGNNQPQGVYEFTNLKQLKSVQIESFSVRNMICNDNSLQQPFSQTLGNKPQKLTFSGNRVKGCIIQLSQLTELKIQHCQIKNLKINKFPLKSIKKIQIFNSKIQNLQILQYDENEKADLQYFYGDGNSLALLKMLNTKVNSIKHLKLNDSNWKGKEQLRLSSICTNIEQLTVEGHCNKLIVDTSLKVINIQGKIAEFIFDNFVSVNNRRQKLILSLSQQCLIRAKFINNTNQVIDVTIKAEGLKSLQTLKQKNKGQNIRFTFISEEQEYLRSEERDISQKQQNLLQQLKISRRRLDEVDIEEVLERFLKQTEKDQIWEWESIQDHQQNYLTQLLFKSPHYQQLSKSYYKQLKEKQEQQQKRLFNFYKKTKQFQQYKQLLEKCYKILQEDQANEFQEYQLAGRIKTQLNQKWKLRVNKRLDRDRKRLLKQYWCKVEQDLAKISEDERKELLQGLASSRH